MAQFAARPTLDDLAPGNDADLRHAPLTAGVSGTYLENFVRSILAHPPALDFEIRIDRRQACRGDRGTAR